MINNKNFVLLVLSSVGCLFSCAHSHGVDSADPGSSPSSRAMMVEIGSSEVSVGDQVRVVRDECQFQSRGERGGSKKACQENQMGEAVVVKVIDANSAVVEPVGDTKLEKGMRIISSKD